MSAIIPFSEIKEEPLPTCDACGKRMWWHGATQGYGCPIPNGDPSCTSSLFHPKHSPNESRRWSHRDRYPELEVSR
jgi:tRNA(Ile2) C34 agmatinyltransferase TiaS